LKLQVAISSLEYGFDVTQKNMLYRKRETGLWLTQKLRVYMRQMSTGEKRLI